MGEGSQMKETRTLVLSLCVLAVLLALAVPQPPIANTATTASVSAVEPEPAQVEPKAHISISPAYHNTTDGTTHISGIVNITIAITPPEVLEDIESVELYFVPVKTPFEVFETIPLTLTVKAREGWAEIEVDWGYLIYWLNFSLGPEGLDWPMDKILGALPFWDLILNVTYRGTYKEFRYTDIVVHHMPGDYLTGATGGGMPKFPWKAPVRSMELGIRPKREEATRPEAPGFWRTVGRKFGRQVRNIYWIISPPEAESYERAVYLYISPWDKPDELYDLGGTEIAKPLDFTDYTKWGYWIAEANVKYGYWYGYVASWDTTRFPDGVYNITVVYEDTDGNYMTYTSFVVLDNTPPKVEITSPEDGATLSGTVEVKFKVVEANPLKAMVTVDMASRELSPGEFDYTGRELNVFSFDSTLLGDGRHTIRIEVEDMAGNTNATIINIEVANTRGLLSEVYDAGRTFGLSLGLTVGLIVGVWIAVVVTKLLLRRR